MIYKASKGTALIRHGVGGPQVSFGALMAFPILHRVTRFDMSVKKIEIQFSGKSGLICRDGIKADLRMAFFVAPIASARDVLQIELSFGSDISENRLKAVFDAKFTEAAKTCARDLEFSELFEDRDKFRDAVAAMIGDDLHGFTIQDCAIENLDQTPLEFLDPNNIIDAQGIKKITEITHAALMKTNELNREIERDEAMRRAQSK